MSRESARTQFGAVGGWRFLFVVAVVAAAWRLSWWILLVLPSLLVLSVLFMLLGRRDTQTRLARLIPDPAVREFVIGFTADQLIKSGQSPDRVATMAEVVLVQRPDVARERAAMAREVLEQQRRQGSAASAAAAPLNEAAASLRPGEQRAQRPKAVARRAQRKRR